MTSLSSVLGVLGMCRVGFRNPTQFQPSISGVSSGVCWVCWVLPRACACLHKIFPEHSKATRKKLYAIAEKPSTPNTPDTNNSNPLIYIGFKCVGFVLGMAVLCWVDDLKLESGHD